MSSSTYQRFLGRFAIGNSSKDFDVGGNAVSLTTGYYYMHGYTGESTSQLLEHMQAVIRAIGGSYASATVSMSTSFKVVINLTTTATITWTDTSLQSLLGFTGSQTGASSYTATYYPRYTWTPSRTPSEFPNNLHANIWQPTSTTQIFVSPDGTTHTVPGSLIYAGDISYDFLTESETVKPATALFQSYQEFFEDVWHAGERCRVILDRSSYSSTSHYITVVYGAKTPGEFSRTSSKNLGTYNGLWRVTIPLRKYL